MFRLAVVFTILGASTAIAQQSTVQQQMPFDACVQNLQTRSGVSQTPTTTIDTSDTKQVQYSVTNSQITVTCSRPNQQVTIEQR